MHGLAQHLRGPASGFLRAVVWWHNWYGLEQNRAGRKPDGRALKWEADQAFGCFGYTPKTHSAAAQPLHFAKVDIATALKDTGPAVALYLKARQFPTAPAFSGGVLDAWPGWAVSAFTALRLEESRVLSWVESERIKEPPHG